MHQTPYQQLKMSILILFSSTQRRTCSYHFILTFKCKTDFSHIFAVFIYYFMNHQIAGTFLVNLQKKCLRKLCFLIIRYQTHFHSSLKFFRHHHHHHHNNTNSLYLNTVKTDGSCTADVAVYYKTKQYSTIHYNI